jgi:DNA-binding transcriptional ArsR family regulator
VTEPERSATPAEEPDAVLRALADPHRRQILRLVQHGELPAGQIAAHFDLTQQAVSQHLTVLKRAGLLAERRDGTRRLYRLRSESLEPLRTLLDEFWPAALARLKESVERSHPRISRTSRTERRGPT